MPTPEEALQRRAQIMAARPQLLNDQDVVYYNHDSEQWEHAPLSRVTVVCDEANPDGDRHVRITVSDTLQATYCMPLRAKRDDIVLPAAIQERFDRQEARWLLGLKKH